MRGNRKMDFLEKEDYQEIEGEGRREAKGQKRTEMCCAHVPTPHEKRDHSALQMCQKKKKKDCEKV